MFEWESSHTFTDWILIGCLIYYLPLVCLGFICWVRIYLTGKRIHYIEIHEEKWCPQYLRDTVLIQLQGGWTFYGIPTICGGLSPAETLGEIISKILFNNNKYEKMSMLLDTCSGASGPTHIVHSQLYKRFKQFCNFKHDNNQTPFCTILSDLWPYVKSWQTLSNKYKNLGMFIYLI